jgi:hypothetical protein
MAMAISKWVLLFLVVSIAAGLSGVANGSAGGLCLVRQGANMKRREFIVGLAGAAATPFASRKTPGNFPGVLSVQRFKFIASG